MTGVKMASSGDLLEGDLVAEGLEAADQAVLEGLLVPPIEVVAAQVAIGGGVLQQVIGDDQDAVADRQSCLLLAAAARQPMILRAEVSVARAAGGLGGLDQGLPQSAVALARPAAR